MNKEKRLRKHIANLVDYIQQLERRNCYLENWLKRIEEIHNKKGWNKFCKDLGIAIGDYNE